MFANGAIVKPKLMPGQYSKVNSEIFEAISEPVNAAIFSID